MSAPEEPMEQRPDLAAHLNAHAKSCDLAADLTEGTIVEVDL